jgi:hypothetical protein
MKSASGETGFVLAERGAKEGARFKPAITRRVEGREEDFRLH